MQTSRVLYSYMGPGLRLSYLNIGITRQASRRNVTATLLEQGVKIQFCPSDEVDAELDTFCKRFNVSMEVAYLKIDHTNVLIMFSGTYSTG